MIRLPFASLALAALLVAAVPLKAQGPSAVPMLIEWWPWAGAGVAGVLAVLGLGALMWRRRKPAVLRLAAPAPVPDDQTPPDLTHLDVMLEITGATRSVMMFTLAYRLTIANRTARAANDLALAVQIVCARRGIANGAAPGAAQDLARVDRVGPHQSRSVTGSVQLPLSAIIPLRQGQQPLFIPLVHITLDGEAVTALTRSFVIGTASAAGRVHPILLDTPPGAIPGLIAQAITIPPDVAASA
jgi:hypothetical protein